MSLADEINSAMQYWPKSISPMLAIGVLIWVYLTVPSFLETLNTKSSFRMISSILGPVSRHTFKSMNRADVGSLPSETNFSQTLVIPKSSWESVGWTESILSSTSVAVYGVDNLSMQHAPANQGHEAMVNINLALNLLSD